MGLSSLQLRERWRREELCISCGTEDALPDRSYGPKCKTQQLSYRQRRISSGTCARCPNPRPENSTLCLPCSESQAAYSKSYRQLKRVTA